MADCEIKLVYFNIRGKAEFIRMLLVAAGVDFEDVRVELQDWITPDSNAKKESPFGQVPYMIYKGKKYGQSYAIGTFLAKKLGFFGQTDEDALREEEVMMLIEDASVPHLREWIMEQDADKKKERERKFKEEHFPRYLAYFEALLADNGDTGFFVGDSLTLADFCLYNFLDTALGIDPEALKAFPLMQKLRSNVEALPALRDYLAKRTQTPT